MIIRNSFRRVLSSLHRRIALGHFLAITVFTLGFSSCYNEPQILGEDIIPSSDSTFVMVDTTFDVSAYTVKTDSMPTNQYTYAVLGNYNSGVFGKVKADFRTRILENHADTVLYKMHPRPLPTSGLKLVLRKNKSWGSANPNVPLNVKVYELSEALRDSLDYQFYYNGLDPVQGSYYPNPISQTTYYFGDTLLKVQLKYDFASKLINAPDSVLTSNRKFIQFMKGLYITCDNYSATNGVLYFFNYNAEMELNYKYYNNSLAEYRDTTYTYYVNLYTPRYNHIEHDYSGSFIEPFLNDTTTENPVFYVEGLGGVRGLIKLDGLKEWVNKMPIAINRAELRFDIDDDPIFPQDSAFSLLYYYRRSYDKTYTNTTKDVVSFIDYNINGSVDIAKYSKPKKYYSIDVTLHLQNLLRQKMKQNYFYIEPSDFKSFYKQGVFRSGNNSKPMKLFITYSKL
jgi:hypothetical protein